MSPHPIDYADRWWRNAVVYCLDIQVFQDSDGDGDGDMQGLVSRIHELADLGVTCLWLMPFFPTADRDDGYDITDFFAVDPRLGTLGDLVEVIRVARAQGMRVIIDFVMNHTSDKHPWFVSSRSSLDSPHRDWYVWRDAPPPKPDPPVFPGEETSTWTKDERTGQYYLHHFRSYQPDLNIAHPAVQEQIERNLGLWLELGVSGFRVDAVPFLFSNADHHSSQPVGTDYDGAEHLRSLQRFVSRRNGEAALLGEVNLTHEQQLAWFEAEGKSSGLQLQFDFVSMQRLYLSLVRKDAGPLASALRERPELPEASQWANFVRNHDELTLDKLAPDELEEVFEAFAPDEGMRVYGRGIRRRLPTMLGDDRAVRLVYTLMFSLPGVPVLFYGEEIGMGEHLDVPGRYAVRTPMQWEPVPGGGFSTAPAGRLVRPLPEGEFAPDRVNVADQRRDPGSLWHHMQRLTTLYRDEPALAWSTLEVIGVRQRAVLGHVCRGDGWTMLALHNLGDAHESVRLEIASEAGPVTLGDRFDGSSITIDGRLEIDLDPYGWRWLTVAPADAVIKRV
ncbi:alpha-amylase family glycosyl hydrolase [Agrococcus sp. HG114]|uniref:alpha-amylase family glycosyl hydrolase n=1 Tax=Agrococcus sp. HG114 TaxID=2969757 RepID=UPI00215A4D13|nr:alpha-amylase family glycosyl hydrolase [Agrococcus sp. HG114]MCR8670877.1 alpha-amylase family glycosyl hydrolase [Agrococcus sp. HG114]